MKEMLLPELAESVVEGEILKWLVEEGDTIALEQPLCEVMTDKVTVELPSPVAGHPEQALAQEGDVVAVHAVIALIDEGGAESPASGSATGESVAPIQAIQDSVENPSTTAEPAAPAGAGRTLDCGSGPYSAPKPTTTTAASSRPLPATNR